MAATVCVLLDQISRLLGLGASSGVTRTPQNVAAADANELVERKLASYLRPKVVVVFSGKRKSGKDYIAEKLAAA